MKRRRHRNPDTLILLTPHRFGHHEEKKTTHKTTKFAKLLTMKRNLKIIFCIVLSSLLLQLLLISYNYYTGFIAISGIAAFIRRLLIGSVFTSLFVGLAIFIDLHIIRWTCRLYATDEPLLRRLLVQAGAALASGGMLGVVLTLLAHLLMPYKEPFPEVLLTNVLLVAVVNFFVTAIIEAFLLHRRNRMNRSRAERLEKENLRLQLETLKKQLDPHFLFNSLNVLSSLVAMDAGRAQAFIDEFSSVYRYTLSAIEKPVVTLAEELEYAHSYLYLQSIRFSGSVTTEIKIDRESKALLLPPLAVQTLLENAFKHNQATSEAPLSIRIYTDGDHLIVENTLNRKLVQNKQFGLGLDNLTKRYELISEFKPEISATAATFSVTLPLLRPQ